MSSKQNFNTGISMVRTEINCDGGPQNQKERRGEIPRQVNTVSRIADEAPSVLSSPTNLVILLHFFRNGILKAATVDHAALSSFYNNYYAME